MKAIVLFITTVFIIGLVNLFTPTPIPLNESDCANRICSISKDDFDYVLQMKDVGNIYRIGDQRKAFIGTYENGIAFDGKATYQYSDHQEMPISKFPFEKYDSKAERVLVIAQRIISEKLYTSYADYRKEYADVHYYFRISNEGLALFDDKQYEYGLIFCEYRDDIFQRFFIRLTETGDDKSKTWYTFGTIDYEPNVLP